MSSAQKKILVIRRDNIGDLACTTPIFSALRARFPDAEIDALVNSYNVAVLENNPDINTVYAYTKAKHRPTGKSLARVYLDRLILFLKLRRKHFDYAILATSLPTIPRTLKLARMVRPKHIMGYAVFGACKKGSIDIPVPYNEGESRHEAEEVFRLLSPLGIEGPPPALKICPDPAIVKEARKKIASISGQHIVGIHISARKPSQRWPAERFVELIKELALRESMAFLLFWSPGNPDNPLHPGDDHKANEILSALADLPINAFPTMHLQELIAGLSLCDALICSDGGAMHLAAGLHKPILCFFGNSSASRWHPWGVPYVLIQPQSLNVADISVDETLTAFAKLRKEMGAPAPKHHSTH